MEGAKRILWLDYDVDVIGILTRPLEIAGHKVDKVATCHDAVYRLSQRPYDGMILDVILPSDLWTMEHGKEHETHYYGLDVLRYMRTDPPYRDIPVVLFSVMGERHLRPVLDGMPEVGSPPIFQKGSIMPVEFGQSVLEAIAKSTR